MMDAKAWADLAPFIFTIILTIIGMTVTWTKQDARIAAVEARCMNEIKNTNNNVSNSNKELGRLEERVSNHKDRLEGKFDLLESKLDTKDTAMHKKIDELKDLIIERISK